MGLLKQMASDITDPVCIETLYCGVGIRFSSVVVLSRLPPDPFGVDPAQIHVVSFAHLGCPIAVAAWTRIALLKELEAEDNIINT